MAKWHPQSKLKIGIIHIQLTEGGKVNHLGLSFDLISPEGESLASRGFTCSLAAKQQARLETILAEIVQQAVDGEGVAGALFPTFP